MHLKANIDLKLPSNVKESTTLRSLRKASVTYFSTHKDIRFQEEYGRIGHSVGTHIDDYIKNVGIALSKPGTLALNGYSNIHANVYPALFLYIGVEN